MAGLETILNEVLDESRDKAQGILDAAKKKASEEISRVKNELNEKEKTDMQAAQEAAKDILERSTSAAQRKGRQIILEKKQKLIEAAIDAAYQALLQMDDETYEQFVLRRLAAYPENLSGILHFVPRDGEIVSKNLKKELKKQHPGFLIDEEPLSADGGFLLSLGQIEVDMTFRSLLDENMELLRDEANRLLFGQEAAR